MQRQSFTVVLNHVSSIYTSCLKHVVLENISIFCFPIIDALRKLLLLLHWDLLHKKQRHLLLIRLLQSFKSPNVVVEQREKGKIYRGFQIWRQISIVQLSQNNYLCFVKLRYTQFFMTSVLSFIAQFIYRICKSLSPLVIDSRKVSHWTSEAINVIFLKKYDSLININLCQFKKAKSKNW